MYLKDVFEKEGLNVKLNSISFNEYFLQEHSDKLINADQIIVWLNIDSFYPNLINDLISEKISADDIKQDIQNKFTELNAYLKQKNRATILWIGAEDYCYYPYAYHLGYSLTNKGLIDRINTILNEIIEENDTYVDLKTIIAKLGIERVFDNKSKYRWNTPYSRDLLQAVAGEVQIGLSKGSTLTTKKSIDCKAIIQKHSKDFGGSLEDPDLLKLCGCSRNSFYKYKRELKIALNRLFL